ncbi:LytR/AlgR family response regulator transcription factor [Flagellimonas algicola]|uniref:Response regulator transcription factor n=1 Tax=Flagellimonas algicola TaxID=2583815 RepID=A0ABY2WFS8_9FLAO|nr:LytTR family DNA-binding domain-containing protein [Allomuricauda algicola]TMU50401.1 response regulator transcription factor [Allomuricauda algicola]
MNCLIVDDEPIAIKVIENHLSEFKDLAVVGTCRNALQAFSVLERIKVDLMFLDIEMSKLDGLSFLKKLSNPPLVILTTAHRAFALEGYDLDIVDYLLKPIALDRFMQAIAKAHRLQAAMDHKVQNTTAISQNSGIKDHIFVKSNRTNVKIKLEEIQFVESIKNHVKISTFKHIHITMVSIGEMEARLPENLFLRIHRSFIVNLEAIENYTHTYVVIQRKSFPIGSSYKQRVLDRLDANRI